MAKKTARKTAFKSAPKPAKKTAQKKKTKKPAAKKTKKAAPAMMAKLAPRSVSTGKGAAPAEIGADLVALYNLGRWSQVEDKWWSPKVVSVEGVGANMAWHGREAVEAKNKWWSEANAVHGAYAEGPYVGSSGFSVKFRIEFEEKAAAKRYVMEEVGVYTVQDGKIVREEFMYGRKEEVKQRPREAGLAPIGG